MKFKILTSLMLVPLTALATNNQRVIDALALQGTLTQGALIHGHILADSQLFLDGAMVKIHNSGAFVIGFGRDSKLSHQLKYTTADGKQHNYAVTLTARDYKIQRVNGISKKISQPSSASIKRARLDSKQVGAARRKWSDNTYFNQSFIWPVTGPISGVYGSQRFYNGKPSRPHFGVDIARTTGTVVVAPADGIVRLFVPDMFYSGGTLIIDHGMGVSSSFLHLSAGLVKAGDRVTQGQPVANIGSSGRATGPHLDWRMNWLRQRVDPQLLVPAMVK